MHNDPEHIRQYKVRFTIGGCGQINVGILSRLGSVDERYRRCHTSMSTGHLHFRWNRRHARTITRCDSLLHRLSYADQFATDWFSPHHLYLPQVERRVVPTRQDYLHWSRSNTGGRSIIELSQQYHLSSISREDYNIRRFQEILSNASFHEQGEGVTSKWIDQVISCLSRWSLAHITGRSILGDILRALSSIGTWTYSSMYWTATSPNARTGRLRIQTLGGGNHPSCLGLDWNDLVTFITIAPIFSVRLQESPSEAELRVRKPSTNIQENDEEKRRVSGSIVNLVAMNQWCLLHLASFLFFHCHSHE